MGRKSKVNFRFGELAFSKISQQGSNMSKVTTHFSLSSIVSQLSKIWKTVVIGILASLGGAGFTVLIAKLTGNPIWMLAKDPAEIRRFPPYFGMLSNWGVILWTATAVICLFSAVLLKQQKAPHATRRFLVASGLFSLLLGIDDLYMFHERLLPRMFHMPEIFFYLLYFLAIVAYLAYFMPQILKCDYLLFLVALLFFIFSRINIPYFDRFMTTGDMLKYFGIVFWLAFFYRTAMHEVSGLLRSEKST
jgi:hypothetical protein